MGLGFVVVLHLILFVVLVFEDGLESFHKYQDDIQTEKQTIIADADQCDTMISTAFVILYALCYEIMALCLIVLLIMVCDLKDKGCFLWHRNSAGLLL